MTRFQDLITDIHALLDNPETEISEDSLEIFAENVKAHLRDALGGRQKARRRVDPNKEKLVASKVGLPPRRLWYDMHDPEPFPASAKINFMYGNILEELVILLAKEAGHEVTEEQKRIEVDGVRGKKDCRIDGMTTDIKSASNFSFKKFSSGEFMLDDDTVDPFGYKTQLGIYTLADNDDKGAFLVINKESGDLTANIFDTADLPDVHLKIEQARIHLERDFPPVEKCYSDIPRGKSGNRVLHKLCTFCPHKFKCWADSNGGNGLIEHTYAGDGTVYFTKLSREPNKRGHNGETKD